VQGLPRDRRLEYRYGSGLVNRWVVWLVGSVFKMVGLIDGSLNRAVRGNKYAAKPFAKEKVAGRTKSADFVQLIVMQFASLNLMNQSDRDQASQGTDTTLPASLSMADRSKSTTTYKGRSKH